MTRKLNFLIPNLDRRADRWECCLRSLLNQNVPIENIQRFSSVDGLGFVNGKNNHFDCSLLHAYMKQHYGELPRFVGADKRDVLTSCAWKCTWLLALKSITTLTDNELVCFMIDDIVLTARYDELLALINSLLSGKNRFLVAQLGESAYGKAPHRLVHECPVFQRGFATDCDHAFIYSAAGAQFVLEIADRINDEVCDPIMVARNIQALGAHPGVFGISGLGDHKDGIAFQDDDVHLLNLHHYNPDITDNGLSSWILEKESEH